MPFLVQHDSSVWPIFPQNVHWVLCDGRLTVLWFSIWLICRADLNASIILSIVFSCFGSSNEAAVGWEVVFCGGFSCSSMFVSGVMASTSEAKDTASW